MCSVCTDCKVVYETTFLVRNTAVQALIGEGSCPCAVFVEYFTMMFRGHGSEGSECWAGVSVLVSSVVFRVLEEIIGWQRTCMHCCG